MRWRYLLLAGLTGAATLTLLLVALYTAVDRQARVDEARPADVIVVLGSQVRPNGVPSNSLYARTMRGVELYKAGYAPTLFLTGGLGRFPPSEAEVMRRLAVGADVPESALILDEAATSTQESMLTLAREAERRGWRTVLVVSDPFHMLRARQMARDVGLDAYAAPAFSSPLHTIERLRRFYTAREVVALLWYFTVGRFQAALPAQDALRRFERLHVHRGKEVTTNGQGWMRM